MRRGDKMVSGRPAKTALSLSLSDATDTSDLISFHDSPDEMIGFNLISDRIKRSIGNSRSIVASAALFDSFPTIQSPETESLLRKETEFFAPESNIFLNNYFIVDGKFDKLIDPVRCVRRYLESAEEEEEDDDEKGCAMILVGESVYYSKPEEENVTARDLERAESALTERSDLMKDRVLVVVEIINYWLEWGDGTKFYFGLTAVDSEDNERFFYLYDDSPATEFEPIYETLRHCCGRTVEILDKLEELWDEEIPAADFEDIANEFDTNDTNLCKFLIEQAISVCSDGDFPFTIICPEQTDYHDEEVKRALRFVEKLIEETDYKVEALSEARKRYRNRKGGRTTSTRRRSRKQTIFTTPLTDGMLREKLPRLVGRDTPEPENIFEHEHSFAETTAVVGFDPVPAYEFSDGRLLIRSLSIDIDGVAQVVRAGDYVMTVGRRIYRILHLFYQENDEQSGSFYFHGALFLSLDDTFISDGNRSELVCSKTCADNEITNVQAIVTLEYIPPPEKNVWKQKESETLWREYQESRRPQHYFVKYEYDAKVPSFTFSSSLSELMAPVTENQFQIVCPTCISNAQNDSQIHLVMTRSVEQGIVLHKGGKEFSVGDAVLLTANCITLRSNRYSPEPRKRFSVDVEQLRARLESWTAEEYPELDRWKKPYLNPNSEDYLSNLFVTPDLYQVALIESISFEDSSLTVSLRMFYRPEDTYYTDTEVRESSSRELFLSDEVHTVPKGKIRRCLLDRCFVLPVLPLEGFDQNFDVWTELGPHRFFTRMCIDPATKRPNAVITRSYAEQLRKCSSSAPEYRTVRPLCCCDLFAGVGGLTLGLANAGVARCRWAVEFQTPHAQAFKENMRLMGNNEVNVICEDVNDMLANMSAGKMVDKYGVPYPEKGEVQMICGGPPCQGFSALNSSKHGQAAENKRAQVAAFLGAVDVLRPRFVLMENVRGLQNRVDGVGVSSLLVDVLRAIGYQVSIQLFQAAQYGVPQDRKRLLFLAAAPGETLPEWPLPTNASWKRYVADLSLGGKTFPKRCLGNKPDSGSLYRPITVWDAVSDLELIPDDGGTINLPNAKSHYQRQMRNGATALTLHESKELLPLHRKRIELVPTNVPRADWRFLPQMKAVLLDGKRTSLLKYDGRALVWGKWQNGRAICEHMRDVGSCTTGWVKLDESLIPAGFLHTAEKHNQWNGIFGRAHWCDLFYTVLTTLEPTGKGGRRFHPTNDRTFTIRELARAQGFPDTFMFGYGRTSDHFKNANIQIGNAVPPPLAKSIGHQIAAVLDRVEEDVVITGVFRT